MDTFHWLLILMILFILRFENNILALDEVDDIFLDENLRNLASDLLSQSSDDAFLQAFIDHQSSSNQEHQIDLTRTDLLGQIYANYTADQIRALEIELINRNHRLYDPIRNETKYLRRKFLNSLNRFVIDDDLGHFERDFLSIGDEIVRLQKMILRIIHSGLENKIGLIVERQPKISLDEQRQQQPQCHMLWCKFNALIRILFGKCILIFPRFRK